MGVRFGSSTTPAQIPPEARRPLVDDPTNSNSTATPGRPRGALSLAQKSNYSRAITTMGAPMTASSIDNPKAAACAFANAVLCACDDELRPIINCVSIAADADGVKLVSTDSHILCVQELALTSSPRLGIETWDGVWTAMLHRDELDVARHVLAGLKDTPIDLERVDEGLLMKVAQREILLPQFAYDGDFPDWRNLLDTTPAPATRINFSSWLVRRLGALKLPNVDKDEATVELDFSGPNGAVKFQIGRMQFDHELKVYGALMPVTGGS